MTAVTSVSVRLSCFFSIFEYSMADLSIRNVEGRAASLASMDCLRSATILSVNMPGSVSFVHSQCQHDPVIGHAGTADEEMTAFGNFDGAFHQRCLARSPFDFEFMNSFL